MKNLKFNEEVGFKLDNALLSGFLKIPEGASGLVIFAHGSGSSRFSPRNTYISSRFAEGGLGTFLFDLLTEEEDVYYCGRFNIDLIASRLIGATNWLKNSVFTSNLKPAFFGADTGAAAALRASAYIGGGIGAIVCRGGRLDFVETSTVSKIQAPTLLIVGENDLDTLEQNSDIINKLVGPKKLEIVPGASHYFDEPGALHKVTNISLSWFDQYLR